MTMIKEKTRSSKVKFSEETLKMEKSVHHKLMGNESHGKVTGFSSGVLQKIYMLSIRKVNLSS